MPNAGAGDALPPRWGFRAPIRGREVRVAQGRFSVSLEWQGTPVRVTLLAGSLRDVGRWLDERYPGLAVVQIERLPIE